ncbi:MAG: hypothetical protein ACHQ1H_05565 [Nitrososphaerales archaeon]
MQTDIFAEVEKQAKSVPARASWRGVLSLNVPSLGLGSVQYHVRAAKAHGDQKPVEFVKVDKISDQQVVARDVPKFFSYKLGPNGERLDVTEIPYDQVKDKVKYNDDYLVFAKNERRYFLRDQLEINGIWTEVPASQTVDKQDGEDIAPFERTTDIEVGEEGYVPIGRIAEYKFKEVYQLAPDTDKKVRESSSRVMKLSRHLLEKQSALVAFFSWGRGYQYYTAVIFPYERRDGKLWLLMGMSEGVLQLDDAWSLETDREAEPAAPMPLAAVKRKPKVDISK